MSLLEKINSEVIAAMKAKDASLEALRSVKAALLLASTEKGGAAGLTEDAEIKLLQKLVKQRKDSAEIFTTQNRPELAQKELFEISVLERFLPKQMEEAELLEILKQIIAQVGASSMQDLGKVMGVASKQLAGKAEGKAISEGVKKLLS